jgi:hypothetical protein
LAWALEPSGNESRLRSGSARVAMNASTTSASNCVPAQARSSRIASAGTIARL